MSETRHTPTPWMVSPESPGCIQAFDPRDPDFPWRIAECAGEAADWFENDEGEVNAAHIVRAVNAFDDLVEALKQARTELEAYELAATGEAYNSLSLNAALAKATSPD